MRKAQREERKEVMNEEQIRDRIAKEYDSMHVALFPKERQEHEDNISRLEKELTLAVWPYPMYDGEE